MAAKTFPKLLIRGKSLTDLLFACLRFGLFGVLAPTLYMGMLAAMAIHTAASRILFYGLVPVGVLCGPLFAIDFFEEPAEWCALLTAVGIQITIALWAATFIEGVGLGVLVAETVAPLIAVLRNLPRVVRAGRP